MNKEFIDAYVNSMKLIRKESKGDPELAHTEADALLCTALKDLGFGRLVNEFRKVEKWYA